MKSFMERVVVRGPLGCFARPETPDRISYPMPPASAARGIIESIYHHPGIHVDIRRVSFLHPIRFLRTGYGYTANMGSFSAHKKSFMSPDRTKRTTTEVLLVDPCWLIEFDWKHVPESSHSFDAGKISEIFRKRVKRGQFFYTPSLGQHQFRALVEPATGRETPISQSRDFGTMVHDIDFRSRPAVPHTFHAVMKRGVVEVPSFFNRVLRRPVRRAA